MKKILTICLLMVVTFTVNAQEKKLKLFQDKTTGGFGFKNLKGEVIIKPEYVEAHEFNEGLAAVKKLGKWGFINTSDEVIIPLNKTNVSDFSEGLAVVTENGHQVFYNKNNQIAVPNTKKYIQIESFSEGLAAVESDNWEWGFIDKSGNEIIPTQFELVNKFSNGMAVVHKIIKKGEYGHPPLKSLQGYINNKGKLIIDYKYYYASHFKEGFANVSDNSFITADRYYINLQGNKISNKYMYGGLDFSEGRARVAGKGGGMGFINTEGKEITKLKYKNAKSFSNGFAAVQNENENWGFIDLDGKEIGEIKYTSVSNFKNNGVALVALNEAKGVITSSGKIIFMKDNIKSIQYSDNYFSATDSSGKIFKFDINGNEVK
ncbi:WG containing repeat [Flavobacteriaceae bacterium]